MSRFKRTEMFMRIADGEESTLFVPVSEYIGKESPYKRPLAIAAVAVADQGVYFSLLHPTKKNVTRYTGNVTFPNPQLSRLERKASQVASQDPSTLFVSMDNQLHELTMTIDPSGLAHLSDAESTEFELPVRGVMMDMYWYSPRISRQVAVTFTGNFGRPGTEETLVRAVAMSLNSLSGLADFRTVSTISRVDVPPARTTKPSTMRRSAVDQVSASVPVYLYREDSTPLVTGAVTVTVDLLNANPTLPVFMCQYSPDDTIAEVFHSYQHTLDRAVAKHFSDELGDDFVERIVCDVVLGDVDERTVTAIKSGLDSLKGVQLTPQRFQLMS